MALIALLLPVVLLGALLGLERLEHWTVAPRRPDTVDLTDAAARSTDTELATRPSLEPAPQAVAASA